MKKIYVLVLLLVHLGAAAQKKKPLAKSDSLSAPVADTLSYAKEYKRDTWGSTWGLRGGLSMGKYKVSEGQVIRISESGTPLLIDGKVVRDNMVVNEELAVGFTGGVFARFVRGAFFIQPELNYTRKAGKFDLLAANGDLVKRVEGGFSALDVPLLLGLRMGKARLFFGPVASFAIKSDKKIQEGLKTYYTGDISGKFFEKPVINFQAGLGFQTGKFVADVRYEHGLNSFTTARLGPANSPFDFQWFASAFNFSIGYIH